MRLDYHWSKFFFHLGFQTTVLKILRSVCFSCSRILIDRDDPAFLKCLSVKNAKARQRRVYQMCSGRRECSFGGAGDEMEDEDVTHMGCGARQPNIKRAPQNTHPPTERCGSWCS